MFHLYIKYTNIYIYLLKRKDYYIHRERERERESMCIYTHRGNILLFTGNKIDR